MKSKPNPLLRHILTLGASSAVFTMGSVNAAIYDWTGATNSSFTTGSNWSQNSWNQWSDYRIGGTPTNTSLTIDGYFGFGSLTLQSGLTTDIVINSTPGANPVIMGTDQAGSSALISIAADSKNLTINGEYMSSTAVTWDVGAGRTLTMAGQLINWYNPASLIKNGAGTAILSNSNSYSGGTTINGGTLSLAAAGALPSSGGVAIGAGGKLSNDAPAGNSFALNGLTLTGGELAATSAPDGSLGNFYLNGDVTVGGSTRSTISADLRVVSNQTRDFNVGATGDVSGVDLLISGNLGHQNNVAWGYATKSGTGTMKLSGSNELGGMTVNAGRLILEDNAVGWTYPAAGLTNNSQLEFSVTSGSRSYTAGIGGTGALFKTGTGTLTLSGSNSYVGGTTINGGTLMATRNTLGTGAVVINADGTLYANDQWVLCGANPYGVNERNIGTLTINAGGTLHLDGTSGFANGATNLYLNGGSITGGFNSDIRGALFLYNGNEQITAGGATTSNIGVSVGVTGNNNTITVDGSSTLNITNELKNSNWFGNGSTPGGFVKAGTGTLSLSGGNTYTGQTNINAGTLLATSNTALGTGGHNGDSMTFIQDGATLALQGGISLDEHFHIYGSGVGGLGALRSLSGNNALTNSPGGAAGYAIRSNTTVGVDADTLSVAGFYEESGSFSLTKVGVGTLSLTAASTYTGATNVNTGTLQVGRQNGLASNSAITVASGAELSMTAGSNNTLNVNTVLTLNGGTLSAGAGAAVTNYGNFHLGNSGSISVGNNTGTSTITGNLSVDGREIYNDNAGFSTISVGDNSTLVVSGNVTGVSGVSWGGVSKSGSGTLKLTGTGDYAQGMSITGGTVEFEENAMSLRNANSPHEGYAADFAGNATLRWATGNTQDISGNGGNGTYSASQMRIRDGVTATLDTNGNNVTLGTAFTLGGSQTGALTKTGTGTLILAATNTYSGSTTVNQGTLIINGNISTSSMTTVQTGATVSGSGTVGSLTVNSGAFLNPGNSPGILSVDGDYSQAGTLTIEITGLIAGSQHDQVNVDLTTGDLDGSVSLSGSLVAAFNGGSYANGNLIFILLNDASDAISGTFSGLAQDAIVTHYGGFDWKISYTADSTGNTFTGGNDVALMAVPEPGAVLLGCLGMLALLRRRRA